MANSNDTAVSAEMQNLRQIVIEAYKAATGMVMSSSTSEREKDIAEEAYQHIMSVIVAVDAVGMVEDLANDPVRNPPT